MQAHEMGENAVIHHLRHDKFAKIEEIIREARQRRVEAFSSPPTRWQARA